MNESKLLRWAYPGTTILLILFLWQLSISFGCASRLIRTISNDDTFLYLSIAFNWAHDGLPSIDRIHITNGFQLIWQLILVSLAYMTDDRILLIRLTLGICSLLNFATGLILLHSIKRLAGTSAALITVIMWACYLCNLRPSLIGMENSLHTFIISAVLFSWITIQKQTLIPFKQLLLMLLLLSLTAAVRLDAAIVSITIFVHIAWLTRSRAWRISNVLKLAMLQGAVVGILYLGINYWISGSSTPISGSVKMVYASRYFEGLSLLQSIQQHVTLYFHVILGTLSDVRGIAPLRSKLGLIPSGVIALSVILINLLWLQKKTNWATIIAVFGLANMIHIAMLVVVLKHFTATCSWYYGCLAVFWCCAIGCTSSAILFSTTTHQNTRPTRRWIWILFSILFIATLGHRIYKYSISPVTHNTHMTRWEAGLWIAQENRFKDVKIGSWNAGELSYFSGRTIVSLDGLTNDRQFLKHLRSDRPIDDYLVEEGIEYVIDYNAVDDTMSRNYSWDRSQSFRGLWDWTSVEIIQTFGSSTRNPVYLLRLPFINSPKNQNPTE